jgi:hypothetical protein
MRSMQVVLPRQPRLGTLLSVEFLQAPKVFSQPFTARVSRVSRHGPAGWIVDCEFVRPLNEQELHTPLASID